MAASSLLPKTVGDFRSQAYWKEFFETRTEAFEWYGTWPQFAKNVAALVPDKGANILVVGCGNSDMSAQMYAAGYERITNVDFDGGVIARMREKTKKKCPKMVWLEADVTNMAAQFPSAGVFDVILDKGTLDAMMTDESAPVVASVNAMFGEVARLLRPGGYYCVVTLAQMHLLKHLVQTLAAATVTGSSLPLWPDIVVDTFAAPDFTSPACQYFVSACKSRGAKAKPAAAAATSAAVDGTADATAASAAAATRVMVRIPGSFDALQEEAEEDASAGDASAGDGTGARGKAGGKGGKKPAAAAATAAASAGAAAAGAASATGARVTLGAPRAVRGYDERPVDFPPAGAAGSTAATTADDAATVAAQTVVSHLAEVQWSYRMYRQVTTIHPDHHLSLDVWFIMNNAGAAASGTGEERKSASARRKEEEEAAKRFLVMITPAGKTAPGVGTMPDDDAASAAAAVDASADAAAAGGGDAGTGKKPAISSSSPRYTITVCDVSTASKAAVILVPQGREHEWMFASREGQQQVAKSAPGFGRLLFVTLNRGHAFGDQKDVQTELSPIVIRLVPPEMRSNAKAIPFLAVSDDIGSRDVIAQGSSPLSGAYVVEDIGADSDEEDEDDATAGAAGAAARASGGKSPASRGPWKLRRLVFFSNRNAIQSEARVRDILPVAPAAGGDATTAVAGAAGKASGGGSSSSKGGKKAAGPALPVEVDVARVGFEYQQAMIAALPLIGGRLAPSAAAAAAGGDASAVASARANILVIGLGGGALPAFLAAAFGAAASVYVVELDPEVVAVATSHFGFPIDGAPVGLHSNVTPGDAASDPSPTFPGVWAPPAPGKCRVIVGDGVAAVNAVAAVAAARASGAAAASAPSFPGAPVPVFDAIIVDVDAKDLHTPISFPPMAFLARPFLGALHTALAPSGLLLVNFACRAERLFGGVVAAIKTQFTGDGAGVFTVSMEEAGHGKNCVIAATKAAAGLAADEGALRAAREQLVAAAPVERGLRRQLGAYLAEWGMKLAPA